MNNAGVPYAIPLLMVGVASVVIAITAWYRRYVPGAVPIFILFISHAVWSIGSAFRLLAIDTQAQIIWSNIATFGNLIVPIAATAFAIEYAGLKEKLPWKAWIILFLEPVFAILLLFADPILHVVDLGYFSDVRAPFDVVGPDYGGMFYVHLLFIYTLLFLCVLLLVRGFAGTSGRYFGFAGLLLLGVLIPWFGSIADVLQFNPLAPMELAPIGFVVTQFAFLLGISRYRFLELLPMAREELIDNLIDGIIVFDLQGRVVDMNAAAQRIIGWRQKKYSGIAAKELLPVEITEAFENIGEGDISGEVGIPGENGVEHYYEIRIAHIQDWRKAHVGYLLAFHDISEQKVLQSALYHSEEKYRSLVERSNDGILIVQNGQITYANRQIASMLGYTVEELLRTSFFDHILVEKKSQMRERYERFMRGEIVPARSHTVLQHRNGRPIEIEISTGLMEYEDRPAALIFIRDITEQRRSAEELDNSLALLQSTIESTADGILVVDNVDNLITYNSRFSEMWRLPGDWAYTFDPDDRLEYMASQTTDPASFRKRAIEMLASPEKEGNDTFYLTDGRVIERYATPYRVSVRDDYSNDPVRSELQSSMGSNLNNLIGGFIQPYSGTSGTPVLTRVAGKVWTFRDVTERLQAEEALRKANEQLTISVKELQRHNKEVTLLGEMGDMLHSCASAEEAYAVVSDYARRLFSGQDGALFVINSARNLVEPVASWFATTNQNGSSFQPVAFPPDRCWGLRRGRLHAVRDPANDLHCQHVEASTTTAAPYICVPLTAQTDTIGVLYLRAAVDVPKGQPDLREQLAVTVAESIAMSLANIRLRESLRLQSIRDPLTGLYNRRYMEEALELELRRARRYQRQVGIIMIDLDHFKNFNDSYGHRAGDLLLKAFGEYLQTNSRSEDIPCRYGGEEFILIMPEANVASCFERAEELRKRVDSINIDWRGKKVGFTISLGVAGFPDHGHGSDSIVGAADAALYEAKRAGRNKVVVAKK